MKLRAGVIGAGIAGACTAHELASAGADVMLFEQFEIDHDRGSSFGESRIIRRFYDDAYYTRLVTLAYPLWRRLEALSGAKLLETLGGLYFGPRDHPGLTSALAGMRSVGAAPELLDAPRLRARFPAFRFDDGEAGLVDDDAGSLNASRCVRAAVEASQVAGATLRPGCCIERVEPDDGEIRAIADDGETFRFDRIAVCAGPWARRLLSENAAPVRATRQQYVHVRPLRDAVQFRAGTMPIWIDAAEQWYGFPEHGEIPGVKVACHVFGEDVDPDRVRREVDAETIDRTMAYLRRRLPALDGGEITYAKTCLYTVSPDEDFIVDESLEIPGCYYFTGCSGHAFKFGVLVGGLLADLVLGRPPRADIDRLRASRF